MAANPQVRLRLEPELVRLYETLAREAKMDLSEYINDRLKLIADDNSSATVAKIAEMVLTIWRVAEVMYGKEVTLTDPLMPKAMQFLCHVLSYALPEQKNKTTEADVKRLMEHIEKLRLLRMNEVMYIGRAMRDNRDNGAAA